MKKSQVKKVTGFPDYEVTSICSSLPLMLN